MMRRLPSLARTVLFSTATLAFSAAPALAEPVVGFFNFDLGNVKFTIDPVTLTSNVDWNDPGPLNPPPNGTETYGNFTVSEFANLAFDPLVGTTGTIQDISQNPADGNYIPLGINPVPQIGFLSFAARPNWTFWETELLAGDLGPFFITEATVGGVTSTTVSLFFAGTALDSITGITSNWSATLSSTFTGQSAADIIAGALAGTLENNTWDGTFLAQITPTEVVPEPATLLTFGAGLALLAYSRRRKAQA